MPVRSAPLKADIAAVASLAVLTIFFFWRILFSNQALFNSDIIVFYYPGADLWARSVGSGHIPLWNPFIYNGFPYLAEPQFSTLYPSIFLNLVMPFYRALAVDLALHTLIASVLMYAFMRRQTLSPLPSLIAAVTFAFSGYFVAREVHVPIIRTATWLPLIFMILDGVNDRPFYRSAMYLGSVLAVQIFAGHEQTVLISTLLAAAYGLWRAAHGGNSVRESLRSVALSGALFAIAISVGFTLAAAQLLPGVELVGESVQAGGVDFDFATSYALPPRQLPMLLAPNMFGDPTTERYWGLWRYHDMIGYSGVATFLLALLGLALSRRQDRLFWGAVALVGVVLALGRATPLYEMAYRIVPGLVHFRAPSRFLLWYASALGILAAFGLDALQSRNYPRRAWAWAMVFVVAVAAAATYWALDAPGIRAATGWLVGPILKLTAPAGNPGVIRYLQDITITEGRRFALLWISCGIVAGSLTIRKMAPLAGLFMLLLVVGDLFTYGMNFYPTVDASELRRRVPTEDILDLDGGKFRIFTTPNFNLGTWGWFGLKTYVPPRPDGVLGFRTAFIPNINMHNQIANSFGYDPLGLPRYQKFVGAAIRDAEGHDGRTPLIDFMGVRYVFTFANVGRAYKEVYRERFSVWLNERALPRGYLITRFAVQAEDDVAVRLLTAGWDPRTAVVLDRPPSKTFGLRPHENPGAITRRSYGLGQVSFDLVLKHPAILVLSDTYYPGWRAFADGAEVPIYRANIAFRAVFLPSGTRHLEFVFRPTSIAVGAAISSIAWTVLIGMLIVGIMRSPQGLQPSDVRDR